MSFLELARKRYSCRSYASDPIPEASLERCLEAARLAPSACNSQPWRMVVVREPKLKALLAEKAFSGVFAMNAFAAEAPVLVIFIRLRSLYSARLGGFLRGIQFSLIDLGIVGQHFVLQAAEEGLGTCWLGWFNEKATKAVLGVSRGERVDAIISLGFPSQTGEIPVKKRKSLGDICVWR